MARPRFDEAMSESRSDGHSGHGGSDDMVSETGGKSRESRIVPSGRRAALRSLGAAVMGLVAASGFGKTGEAKQKDNNSVDAEHRRRRRRRRAKVNSTIVLGNLAALPTPGLTEISSVATCASNSALLGCGYDVNTNGAGSEPLRALKDTIADVVPSGLSCTATLTRVDPNSPPGSVTAVAQIQAYAICRV
jgi:hypothetical protein